MELVESSWDLDFLLDLDLLRFADLYQRHAQKKAEENLRLYQIACLPHQVDKGGKNPHKDFVADQQYVLLGPKKDRASLQDQQRALAEFAQKIVTAED